MAIDRESPVPLYHQLKELLGSRITQGEWGPGDMLPTEEQLEDHYELSRITVRRALKELELAGLISRFRGRGTFVSWPKVRHSPEPHLSLSDYLLEKGMRPGWKLLSAEWESAPDEVAGRLMIDPGREVYHLRRLRLANEEPIGYHSAYVSPAFSEAVDASALMEGGSLRYLRGRGHLEGSVADRTLEAVPASDRTAELLGVDRGSPMLMIRRLVLSKEGEAIEDFCGVYRGDRFQYRIRHLPAVNPINE